MHPADASMVSCIVPVYNGEPYVRETIKSILAQTHRPLEIIVVDDGSTDGTAEVVREFDRQVKYVYQSNAGPAAARNGGIGLSCGDFVAFNDADDLWHEEKLERQLIRFRARPELAYCVTHCQNFWVPELEEEAQKYRNHRISLPMPAYVTGTLLARRSAFDTVGFFNIDLGHGDGTEWFLRASERGAVGELLPDVLMYRRLHPTNRSRVLAEASRDQYLTLLKETLDRRRKVTQPNS
jgi:glycosyltransferase involved in cell wall biosynthesis